MPITIFTQGKDLTPWLKVFKEKRPDLEVRTYSDNTPTQDVEFAMAWNHPLGVFKNFPNLKCIASMGAGVDHVLRDPELPAGVAITKIIDTNLTKDMAEFILVLAMDYLRGISAYKVQQLQQNWQPIPYKRIEEVRVGVMGVGVLGMYVAQQLHKVGFRVSGWARTAKRSESINIYAGAEDLNAFLSVSDILVCLLPLTPDTANMLNKATLSKLPKDAFVINVARGEHVVEKDLLQLLDSGHLSGASLDVFRQEPLPENNSLWTHPKINITPHMASKTDPTSAVDQILENYDRLMHNKPLINTVSLQKGY
ncbi:2-hydroxyacid dehydrogenase [Pontibacter rugosus]|uniref:2-hydroxyacid dehydrogenase n=1 Tax=Pontibacter rugosus TaxID=1745966 RepID=A0ABW3SLH6_9BACT